MNRRSILAAAALLIAATHAAIHAPGTARAEAIAVVGGTVHTMTGAPIPGGTVLINDGRIEAVGAGLAVPDGYRVIDAAGKPVTPGIMNAFTRLGIVEVSLESATNDDAVRALDFTAAFDVSYGINPRATAIPITRVEGVTRAAVSPVPGDGLFAGQGAVIHLGDGDDVVVEPRAFMLAALGETGAAKAGSARGSAFVTLITAIEEAARYRDADDKDAWEGAISWLDAQALVPVTTGETPLMIIADRASDITQVIGLSQRYRRLDIVLLSAREGWLVADALAAADIPVVLHPLDNLPADFESLAATQHNAARLHAAGVTIAIAGRPGGDNAHQSRLVLQYAGNAVANGLPWDAAMAALTVNPARLFGIQDRYGTLAAGQDADVVVWDGDPLEVMSAPDAVIVRGVDLPLVSRQTKLRDRYQNLGRTDRPFAYRR